jgi:hypothetical protein
MHTPTFPQKSSSSWLSWRGLFSLLALVINGFSTHLVWAQNPSFYNEAVSFAAQPTGSASTAVTYTGRYLPGDTPYNLYTLLGTAATAPARAIPSLGTYDVAGNSKLVFTGGSLVCDPPLNKKNQPLGTINSVSLVYRVYLANSTVIPEYSPLQLLTNSTYNSPNGNDSDGAALYSQTANVDLLTGLLGGGDYIFELTYKIVVTPNGSTVPETYVDPSSASYQASFRVTPPPVTPTGGTTIWQSTGSTDWSIATNWSNGVPTATSNAIIPSKDNNSALVYPVLNNVNTPYAVKNLTLQGNTSSSAGQLTINAATLTVYGDLQQISGGINAATIGTRTGAGVRNANLNSTIIFAGDNQIITGNLIVADVIIAGSGIKSVINVLNPLNTITFQPSSTASGVILQSAAQDLNTGVVNTVFDTTGNSYILLDPAASIGDNNINGITSYGETTVSYIKGVSRASRTLSRGNLEKFGNIGLELTPNHTPGNIIVYRVVGDPLKGPVKDTNPAPIKRQYKITGDDDSGSAATASSSLNVIFHYLPSSAGNNELNGIEEGNLVMFRTVTNGVPYTQIDGTLDVTNHIVTATIPSLTNFTLTLGDKTNPLTTTPLPVVLTAFDAARSGLNAQLIWATASEKNNAGFEVQVSADGSTFRKLTFVASKNGNSNASQNYTYIDTEANKAGIRYYRLRQVDIDGTEDFSPVRAVSFSALSEGLATALSAYPNPYSTSDVVKLSVQTTTVGTAHLHISDLIGREVANQTFTTVNGVTEIALDRAANLNAGTYMARVTLASGEVKTVRIQKR